jgi:hypothetical protein
MALEAIFTNLQVKARFQWTKWSKKGSLKKLQKNAYFDAHGKMFPHVILSNNKNCS